MLEVVLECECVFVVKNVIEVDVLVAEPVVATCACERICVDPGLSVANCVKGAWFQAACSQWRSRRLPFVASHADNGGRED